ncbi:MAG: hypothetical protein Kow00104_17350 [Rhodothalassiaceae bacterium]
MSKLKALLTREIIEHRTGMITAPAVIMTLMTLLTIGTMAFGLGKIGMASGGSVHDIGDLLNKLAEAEPFEKDGIVISFLSAVSMPALLILPIVMFFIALGALYEERRDRSFLFWKSMPVSDSQEVLVKFGAAMLIAPLAFLIIGILFQLLMLLMLTGLGLLSGGAVGSIWQLDAMLLNWIHAPVYMMFWALWASPVYAWVLLSGSFAPRAPFMFAVVPPVALIVIEEVLLDSQHFAKWLGTHLSAFPMLEAISKAGGVPKFDDPEMPEVMMYMARPTFGPLFESLAMPEFWIGVAIAALLLAATVRMRRYIV